VAERTDTRRWIPRSSKTAVAVDQRLLPTPFAVRQNMQGVSLNAHGAIIYRRTHLSIGNSARRQNSPDFRYI